MFLEERKNNIMAYDLQDLRYNIMLSSGSPITASEQFYT